MPVKQDLPLLLVVDDDSFFLKQVAFTAQSIYRVIQASTLGEIGNLHFSNLHTLILDLNIPNGNAVEFMLSFADIAHRVNLIIISGLDTKTVNLCAAIAENTQFKSVHSIKKPFNVSALRDLLERLACFKDISPRFSAVAAQEKRTTAAEVRTALANKEFVTYFQPQICSKEGRFSGAEALIRWRHPAKGILQPSLFIELLESQELALPFTLYVAEDAVRRFQSIEPELRRGAKLSINVPHAALEEPRFTEQICEILDRHSFHPSDLVIEITERGVRGNSCADISSVAMMRIKGIEISIDDFGTGNSGFERLKTLAVDEIKIDKLFIGDICESRTSQLLVQSIMQMAKTLDIRVVIEGIETEESLSWLRDQGNFIAQGYYFSKPVSCSALIEFLQTLNPNSITACSKIVSEPCASGTYPISTGR